MNSHIWSLFLGTIFKTFSYFEKIHIFIGNYILDGTKIC